MRKKPSVSNPEKERGRSKKNKVITSSSHNAEHGNIRREKGRKPVGGMKHMTAICRH